MYVPNDVQRRTLRDLEPREARQARAYVHNLRQHRRGVLRAGQAQPRHALQQPPREGRRGGADVAEGRRTEGRGVVAPRGRSTSAGAPPAATEPAAAPKGGRRLPCGRGSSAEKPRRRLCRDVAALGCAGAAAQTSSLSTSGTAAGTSAPSFWSPSLEEGLHLRGQQPLAPCHVEATTLSICPQRVLAYLAQLPNISRVQKRALLSDPSPCIAQCTKDALLELLGHHHLVRQRERLQEHSKFWIFQATILENEPEAIN
mmetsp:Transcript_22187/g.62129  ORF Transcript_22187/g.62129 Transcript_22187/m.62129 type:complete len:258 (+) Transcript_22187:871-1644(+)